MSSHHLTALEQAVLALLTGTSASTAAMRASLNADEVTRAAARYQAAGRAALTSTYGGGWYQINIKFADPHIAATIAATELLPQLRHAHEHGGLGPWWYIRKAPHWRFRFHTDPRRTDPLRVFIGSALDDLTARQLFVAWTEGVYEPEAHAFGGHEAMDIAHRYFHVDSVNILTHLDRTHVTPQPTTLGLREMSLLTCAALLRAAGQDWHEQGDVWHRVAQMRLLDPTIPRERIHAMTDGLHQTLTVDTERATTTSLGRALKPVQPWLTAANTTGEALRELAGLGKLRRGLRDVLAHHIIFHWNRVGLSHRQQAVLAHAATFAILALAHANDSDPVRIADVAHA